MRWYPYQILTTKALLMSKFNSHDIYMEVNVALFNCGKMKEYVFTKCVKIEQRHVIILDHAVKQIHCDSLYLLVDKLQWQHNERHGVSNHQQLDGIFNDLKLISKKPSVLPAFAKGIRTIECHPILFKRMPFIGQLYACPHCKQRKPAQLLTHCGRDKMAAILQTIFSNAFSRMKMHELRLKFHCI